MATESRQKCPQDLVAIFHASFHPTQGNLVDWSLKASDDLNLDNVEFSALPSGLHLVEQDVVYFNKDGQHGVCIFRRRKTVEEGHRGFRLSSLGILLARSRRPRPWRHVKDLKQLIDRVYAQCELSGLLQPTEDQWEPAHAFFEERKVRRADLGGAGDWTGWSHELCEVNTDPPSAIPTLHLPHLLRILGPSSLTLYKHILTRRRILIYTLPPVEAACVLCQVAADMCYEIQYDSNAPAPVHFGMGRLKGKCKEPINVLGMITLSDMDRLRSEGSTDRGWIACTTDAIFLERPNCYDLLIDLTTSTPNKATRPTFYTSKLASQQAGPSSRPTHRLSVVRFAWSDVRLWNELERILQLNAECFLHPSCCGPSTSVDPGLKPKLSSPWTDVWRVYEDVCIICAGLWMGTWRSNSTASYSTADGPENWGAIRLDGDDDLSMGNSAYIRSLGMGIEGRPVGSSNDGGSGVGRMKSQSQVTVGLGSAPQTSPAPTTRAMRRTSAMSWSSGRTAVNSVGHGKGRQPSSSSVLQLQVGNDEEHDDPERRDRQTLTTLSLLQTFHAHTSFQLSVLESFLPPARDHRSSPSGSITYLLPKDLTAFELGPLSNFDARYLEWLGQEYAGAVKVVVKRSWKDLLSAFFGYA